LKNIYCRISLISLFFKFLESIFKQRYNHMGCRGLYRDNYMNTSRLVQVLPYHYSMRSHGVRILFKQDHGRIFMGR